MDFGSAITHLKAGNKVARSGWNGKNMWLIYVPGSQVVTTPGSAYHDAGEINAVINPHIDIKTVTGEMQPGWLASQADILATDWEVVE